MDAKEETAILEATGCPRETTDTLIVFADKYRRGVSTSQVVKDRKLGTRSLVRIARRLALFPKGDDLHRIIQEILLSEFMPPAEKIRLDVLFEDSGIHKSRVPVGLHLTVTFISNLFW